MSLQRRFAICRPTGVMLCTLLMATSVQAGVSTLIETSQRTDIAFDTLSKTLYISGSDVLQRYSIETHSFLVPLYLGGSTMGMDISTDGRYLAVANGAPGASQNFVDLVDLNSGGSQRIAFNREFGEGGTFTVAFDGNNGLLVSSEYEGSGWVPLRRYDLATKQTITLGSVRQNSMLAASADRSVVAVAESNISSGSWGVYKSGASSFKSSRGTGWFNFEIGVSRDGSQVAVPTYGGTYIEDSETVIPRIGQYAGGQPIGVAYSPNSDVVYFPWAESSMVYAYDTETGRRIEGYDFEESFSHTGNWAFNNGRAKVAADGSYLFVTTSDGVRFMPLAAVPEPSTYALMGLGLVGLAFMRRRTLSTQASAT